MLMRIKHEYDAALDDALASVYDNVHMRAELASAEEMMVGMHSDYSCKALTYLIANNEINTFYPVFFHA